ncbi:MAG: F0F1 ATP synthase subunit A [Candidatus Omnitrophica bacterium]|nr:F0F1 ATP synthase subunit A [Candidatus Omnitrophota bacterium]
MHTELPTLVSLIAEAFHSQPWAKYLIIWQNLIYSLLVVFILILIAIMATRKKSFIPGRLQSVVEVFVGVIDDFVCGILGPSGRRFVPFVGTLFIYILFMNLIGLVPYMKSSTSGLSTTVALALCVFVYVHYSAIKELGFLGYLDHLMGKPRGVVAFSVILPLFMLFMHIVTELIKPVTLSLRLRSNIFADDMLIAALSSFGIKGLPFLFFSMFIVVIAAVVQALVFSLLSTIYFAIFLVHDEEDKGHNQLVNKEG